MKWITIRTLQNSFYITNTNTYSDIKTNRLVVLQDQYSVNTNIINTSINTNRFTNIPILMSVSLPTPIQVPIPVPTPKLVLLNQVPIPTPKLILLIQVPIPISLALKC